jgi:hypothetical protein
VRARKQLMKARPMRHSLRSSVRSAFASRLIPSSAATTSRVTFCARGFAAYAMTACRKLAAYRPRLSARAYLVERETAARALASAVAFDPRLQLVQVSEHFFALVFPHAAPLFLHKPARL